MRTPLLAGAACLVAFAMTGCANPNLKQAGYETLRSISNDRNAPDPNYDPGSIGEYNQYKAKRDQYLQEQKEPATGPIGQ